MRGNGQTSRLETISTVDRSVYATTDVMVSDSHSQPEDPGRSGALPDSQAGIDLVHEQPGEQTNMSDTEYV